MDIKSRVIWAVVMAGCILLNVNTICSGKTAAVTLGIIAIACCSITMVYHLIPIVKYLHEKYRHYSKVVINGCYGGYGLSDKALAWLQQNGGKHTKEVISQALADAFQMPEDERMNHVRYEVSEKLERHNPDLVRCVEELGKDANTEYSELQVVTFPGRKYLIYEYDGLESIEYPSNLKWIEIPRRMK